MERFRRAASSFDKDELLDSQALALLTGYCAKSVERMFRRKLIPGGFKLAGEWRVRRRTYNAWIDALECGDRRGVAS